MVYGFTVTPGNMENHLQYAAAYNFRLMELSLPAIIPFELMFHETKIRAMRKFSEENILSYAFNIPFTLNIGDIFPEVREKALNYLMNCLKFASKLNARRVNMHFGKFKWFPYEDIMRRRTLDRFAENIKPALDVAEKFNINLTLENLYPVSLRDEYYYLGDNCFDFEYLFGKVDSPNLKVCLNAGHANLAEGVEFYADKLADKLECVHICDNRGDEDDHLCPGDGTVNWSALIDILGQKNFRGPYIAECPDEEPHEVIKRFEWLLVESKMKYQTVV